MLQIKARTDYNGNLYFPFLEKSEQIKVVFKNLIIMKNFNTKLI